VTTLRDRFAYVFFVVAAVLLVFSVVVMTAQITMRAVLDAPMIWTEEVVRYLFVWSVYLGCVVGVIRDSHIRVMFAVDWFGARGRLVSDVLSRAVNAFCFGFLLFWGVDLAFKYQFAEFYTLPGWSQFWFFYASLPFSALMCLIFTLLPGHPSSTEHTPPGETAL
jgi:TRAP-type C4-dicarboxylate transport system permease small subunit